MIFEGRALKECRGGANDGQKCDMDRKRRNLRVIFFFHLFSIPILLVIVPLKFICRVLLEHYFSNFENN